MHASTPHHVLVPRVSSDRLMNEWMAQPINRSNHPCANLLWLSDIPTHPPTRSQRPFLSIVVRLVPACMLVGASMELFMLNTGFCE